MKNDGKQSSDEANVFPSCELAKDFPTLARSILLYANKDVSRIDFMRQVSRILLQFSGCDAVELRTQHDDLYYCCYFSVRPEEAFVFETKTRSQKGGSTTRATDSGFEALCESVFRGAIDLSHPCITGIGTFWTGDTDNLQEIRLESGKHVRLVKIDFESDYKSLAIVPFVVDEENSGLLILKSLQKYFLTNKEVEFYEGVAQTLGVGVSCRRAQAALRERVKELTCLYNIAKVVNEPDLELEEMLQHIVEILPSAWQYPKMASARIVLDEHTFSSAGDGGEQYRLSSQIFVNNEKRGVVEIFYGDEGLAFEGNPFLWEERKLINVVARELGGIIGVKQADEEKSQLQEQIRHADRLATIGQFAAGAAHELNEPLGKILGFAQLAKKCEDLPGLAGKDIDKIINASLHARETVKKLLVFTRKMPETYTEVNLNKIVSEDLFFFESQCVKQGIEMVRSLTPDLPYIAGDPAQINQVLVNFVVNAI